MCSASRAAGRRLRRGRGASGGALRHRAAARRRRSGNANYRSRRLHPAVRDRPRPHCLSQSIDRSGAARDGRVAQATASNTRYQTAKEDRGLALDAVEDAALATLQLCRPGQSKSACREARIAETAARERLALASQTYVAAGAPVVPTCWRRAWCSSRISPASPSSLCT